MTPSIPLLLITGLYAVVSAQAQDGPAARTADRVPIEIAPQHQEEPLEINQRFDNPCAYDPAGNPISTTKKCAGAVQALARPRQIMGWVVTEDGTQMTSYLENVQVPFALVQELRVTSDFTDDTCAYNATLEHELKHWKANVELFKKAVESLRREIGMISLLPSKDKPITASRFTSTRFREQVDKLVHTKIDNVRKKLIEDMRESVAELDEPARYLRDDWSKCPAADWKGKK